MLTPKGPGSIRYMKEVALRQQRDYVYLLRMTLWFENYARGGRHGGPPGDQNDGPDGAGPGQGGPGGPGLPPAWPPRLRRWRKGAQLPIIDNDSLGGDGGVITRGDGAGLAGPPSSPASGKKSKTKKTKTPSSPASEKSASGKKSKFKCDNPKKKSKTKKN